jgi:multidrug resistance efflux pump
MTWLQRTRPVVLVCGGLFLIGSLLGAGLLASGAGTQDKPKSAAPTNGKNGSGPVFIGFVDSDPSPVQYGLPPVMQAGLVVEVCVKEGQHVAANVDLIKFDSSIQFADLKRAESLVGKAKAEEGKALGAAKYHDTTVANQKLAVSVATFKAKRAAEGYSTYEKTMREQYVKAQGWDKLPALTAQQQLVIDDQLSKDPQRFKLETERDVAAEEAKVENAKLDDVIAAKATRIDPLLVEAKAGIDQAEAEVKKAKAALDLCTIKSKTAGVVEQINVSPGTVLGMTSRIPALRLIPDGPRVVRAEVEAEFAHRVTEKMIGREVTIYDNTDPKITYKGKLLRVSDSFLPKRSAGDNLLGNDTKVLEAVVEVVDPTPEGVPPLRIGQKVKVNFGQ